MALPQPAALLLPGQLIDRTGAGVLVCGDAQRRSDERVMDVLRRLVALGYLTPKIELGRTIASSTAELERWWEKITLIVGEGIYDNQSFVIQSPSGLSWFHEAVVEVSIEAFVEVTHEFDRGDQWLRLTIPRGMPDNSWAQAVQDLPGVLDLTGVPDLVDLDPVPCVDLETEFDVTEREHLLRIPMSALAARAGLPADKLKAHLLRPGHYDPQEPGYQPARSYGHLAELYVGLRGCSELASPRVVRGRGLMVPLGRFSDTKPQLTWRLKRPAGVRWSAQDRASVFDLAQELNDRLAAA
jgi:hypothetical protein